MDLMDFNWDELLEVPIKWLETIVDYLPEWPPSWLPDGPPDWLIDLVEKYAPYLPSAYFSDLFQFGLPHFYVQQNVCEKAFDIGVLTLTFGTLIIIVLLLRRCLASEISRSKDRWICYECRAEKSEVLSEDLIHVEKRVDSLKNACQNVNKKLQACLQGQGTDGPALEKRMKKLPEILLSNCMIESSIALGEPSVFGTILSLCGKVQKLLGNEILEYEIEVEKDVINKQLELLEVDIPNIVKQRKHLAKLTLDMDSAKTRYQTAARHSLQMSGTNAAKADVIKEEMDDASMKVEQCRDVLVSDMFTLISKETELAQHFVTLVKTQAEYHKKALNILDSYTNCMEEEIRNSQCRPIYGCLLEDHLKVTERHIALPIEVCICFLMEYGLNEEGLFRVAGSASKVKKLRAAFDANMYEILEMNDYIKDPHAVAGALKSYLRELPNPLTTHELYNEWIQAARISDTETRSQNIWSIVQKLPVPYFNNLRYIMKFLNKLSTNQEVNKMTAQNLAIVIAPNLIWAPEDGSSALGMNMSLANMYSLIVDNLITHADWFFPGDVEFYLPSPLLRSPHDAHSFQSNPLHPPESDSHQINGELDVHPSLFGPAESSTLHFNQQSSQYGGSPKSLRRNKKPAPPAPSGLREKPSFLEKLAPDKTVNNENKLEKTSFEKNSVERKSSSSSSDKERHLPLFASNKPNHVDKNQINSIPMEKPQIPEKPNFEKIMTSPVDLAKPSIVSAPVPSERHHIEKVQTPMSLADKSQLHNIHHSEENSPVTDESKNIIPEIIVPTVESDYDEDESDDDDMNNVPYHPHSPAPVDRFDYYRPDWYGSEQDESEKIKEIIEQPKSDIIPPGFIYLKKNTSVDEIESKELNIGNELSEKLEGKIHESLDKLEGEASQSVNEINKGIDEILESSKKVNDEFVETELKDASSVVLEMPPPSEELIVIGQPPHSIHFVRPENSSEQKLLGVKDEKELFSKSPPISPDILGNLPFLSRKSPTFTNDHLDQIPKILSSNVDEELGQSSSSSVLVKNEDVSSTPKEANSNLKEETLEPETSSADQKQAESTVEREGRLHHLTTLHNFPSLSSRSESEMEYEFGDHSYTDSDRWSHSERSLSPDYLSSEYQQSQHHSSPAFAEHQMPKSVEEPMFEMSDWHSRKIHSVYQRSISPQSSHSVPYSSPSKHKEDDYRNSSTSLPRKLTAVDTWFSTDIEPVAKPRKPQRRSPSSSSRPKRPALSPRIGIAKPKRPAKPPQLNTREIADTLGNYSIGTQHSQIQETSHIPFDSRTSASLPEDKFEVKKLFPEQQSENWLQSQIRGSPAAPKRPPRPQPPPPPPPFKPRHNSSSEDTHL